MIGSDASLTDGNNHPRATGCFPFPARGGRWRSTSPRTTTGRFTTAPVPTSPGTTPGLQPGATITASSDLEDGSGNAFAPAGDPDVVVDREPGPEPD